MLLRSRFFCLVSLFISPLLWGYTYDQTDYILQRFLEENSGEQPLLDQLSVRVSSPPVPLNFIQTKTLLIGMIFTGTESDLENRAWLVAFKKRMQALRIDYRLDVFYMSDTPTAARVASVYESVRNSSFDYLIVDGVNEYSRGPIERLLKRNSPRVIMLNVSSPFRAWRLHSPLVYVGVDHTQAMNRLSSYLNRRLEREATIDVISVEGSYLSDARCRVFVNQLKNMGRSISAHYSVQDSRQAGRQAALSLLKRRNAQKKDVEHFIFSCTPAISTGVLLALDDHKVEQTYTNSWSGQLPHTTADDRRVLVTVLGMHDNMAITSAEVIKANIESRLLPTVYVEPIQLFTQDMDQQTLNLMYEQVFRYSRSIWLH